jgi:ElaB/YqjD/DUF883 family membrane-anchored ribosome-binding protein
MRRVVEFFKKFGWIIASVLAFVFGALTFRKKKHAKANALEERRKELENERAELKEKQRQLEKEADEIAKEKPFSDADNAAKFINNILKRKQ